MSDFKPEKIPQELIKGFQRNKCGIFVGAGLSIAAGLPDWKGLISDLIDLVSEIADFSQERAYEYRNLLANSSKYLLLAEELKEELADDFRKYITRKFSDESPKPNETHLELIRLPYKFIITTNYDILLERAYIEVYHDLPTVLTYQNPEGISYNLWHSRQFILKAHGDAKSAPQDIILTEKDYRHILYREPGYKSILETLFTTNSILLLGTSLNDPELKLLLGYIHNAFHEGGPTHYALVDKNVISKTESNRWRKDFNVKMIPYDSAENHIQVLQFLETLKRRVASS